MFSFVNISQVIGWEGWVADWLGRSSQKWQQFIECDVKLNLLLRTITANAAAVAGATHRLWTVAARRAALAWWSRESAVQCKLAVIMQCLQNWALKYLVVCCIPVSDVRHHSSTFTLRQSTSPDCAMLLTKHIPNASCRPSYFWPTMAIACSPLDSGQTDVMIGRHNWPVADLRNIERPPMTNF